ncbi:MAG: DUF4177 domain-containing protein [Planctomycetota bacterium]
MTCQYEYRTVPMAPTITAHSKKNDGVEAASYLQSVIAQNAVDGWEFYRVDTFSVQQPSGCLAVLAGRNAGEHTTYYVATFRRPAAR